MLAWAVAACALIALLVLLARRRQGIAQDRRHVRTLIVLGSGGHTAELTSLVTRLDAQLYQPRSYVVAATDRLGAQKAQACEAKLGASSSAAATADVRSIPRSREVGQSYVTSALSTAWALLAAVRIVAQLAPDLVFVNGPGTCIPICLATRLFRLLGCARGKIVYLESIARVDTLSLSGKLLYFLRLADAFFVQWPELQARYPRAQYRGRLY